PATRTNRFPDHRTSSLMTTPTETPVTTDRPWTTVLRGWDRFWFEPGDPTVLGLVRICAGLMVLYITLAFSWDLQAFFGPDGWVSLQTLNEMRREGPLYTRPADRWQEVPSLQDHPPP